MKVGIRATRACIWYVGMHVCISVCDLAVHVRCIVLLSHTQGAQHIAAALAHNSTLQTLM
jgi:hypothetical protein